MKIYDPESKRVLSEVTLFLTPEEAAELAASAQGLANDPSQHHTHVSDADYQIEITIAVYTPDNFEEFDEESRRVIDPSGSGLV